MSSIVNLHCHLTQGISTYSVYYIHYLCSCDFILTVKNLDQTYTKLMRLKFNMLVLMIDDDLHGYETQPVFTLSEKKYPDIQTAEKKPGFLTEEKKDGLP